MLLNMYSLKDEVDQFGAVLLLPNDAAAMRITKNAYDQPNSIYQTNPADFTLYKLGQFDTISGEVIPELPTRICSCSDFRKE